MGWSERANVMVCNVCGSRAFNVTEYRSSGDTACRAPAFACCGCGAISLGEEAAENDEERQSVKVAIAMRAHVADGVKGRAQSPRLRGSSTSTARVKIR
jgi:hypothetical protein